MSIHAQYQIRAGIWFSPDSQHPIKRSNKLPEALHGKSGGMEHRIRKCIKGEKNQKLFRQTKKALANHLQRICYLMPEDKRKELQKLFIRVDHMHELSNMQYHPSQAWLIKNNHDPSLVKRVHIPRAQQLIARSTWLKHPYVILHELAHAYHDPGSGL